MIAYKSAKDNTLKALHAVETLESSLDDMNSANGLIGQIKSTLGKDIDNLGAGAIGTIMTYTEQSAKCYSIEQTRQNFSLIYCKVTVNAFKLLWLCIVVIIIALVFTLIVLVILRPAKQRTNLDKVSPSDHDMSVMKPY